MTIRFIIFVCALMLRSYVDAFAISPLPPTAPPLQYISPLVVMDYFLENTASTLQSAMLPSDMMDAAAVIASEGAAGALGGIAGKGLSIVDGNKNNKDNAFTNAGASGAFFAIRSGLRALSTLVGMSTPLVGLLTLIIATVSSEVIKMRARAIETQQKRVGDGPAMIELMRFRDAPMKDIMAFREYEYGKVPRTKVKVNMNVALRKSESDVASVPFLGTTTRSEVAADLVKWIMYGFIAPEDLVLPVQMFTPVVCGAASGIASQMVREGDDAKQCPAGETVLLRMTRAAAEGAIQFLTYEVSRQVLLPAVPLPDPDSVLMGFQEAALTIASTVSELIVTTPVQ
jgi:hypothetical protein